LFKELEMKQSEADPCLYYARDRQDGTVMRIAKIVDDFNIQGNSKRLLKLAWALHTDRLSMKDMGTVQMILKNRRQNQSRTGLDLYGPRAVHQTLAC
jgi:hypothetical protein